MPSMPNAVRPWIQRILLVLFGLIFSLLLSEVCLRIWTPSSLLYKQVRQSDPILHHSFKPSAWYIERKEEFEVEVRTNSLGLRDREYGQEIAGAFRIIVLGDSFTEGVGVDLDSTYPKQLEDALNVLSGNHKFVVFNFGIAGYSPILEYLILEQKGMALHPDLVILSYDMTDVQEDVLYAEDAVFDSTGAPIRVNPSLPDFGQATRFPRGAFKTFLQENLFTYPLVVNAFERTNTPSLLERGNIHASRFTHTIDSTAEPWKQYFDQSESYVKLIHHLCSRNNIRFLLSVFPRGHQVNALEWVEGRKYWGLDSTVVNSAIFSSLAHFAQMEGMHYLDMTLAFRSRSHGELYYPVDGHWTAAGHRVAADTLLRFLLDKHLIDN